MEHKEPLIPRHSPEVALRIGERALNLTYFNTVVSIYTDPFDIMNNVQHKNGDDKPLTIFHCDELIDQLAELDYFINSRPWPSDNVIRLYERFQSQRLEQELEEL